MAEEQAMSEPRLPFPHLIDNSMRGDFVSCPKKFYWAYVRNITGSAPNIHLHAGGAFAAGLESARRAFYERQMDEAHALKAGLEALIKFYGPIELPPARSGDKSLDNVIRAFDSYFQRYPLASDIIKPLITANGKAMVEFNFTIPLEIKHPQTGEPLLYGGRSDMIGVMHDALWVTDEKTAASLGETWAAQWDLESQFTGYAAAARLHGYPVAGALIRGVGLLKTKISHSEVTVYRPDWIIERWWQQLHRDVKRMLQNWEEGYWDLALAKSSCSAYGGCLFDMLDKQPDSEHARYIEAYYRPRNWNPLAKDHGENLLEQPGAKQLEAPELVIPGLPEVK